MSTRLFIIQCCIIALSLSVGSSCNGQNKTPKLKKNYFITQYPQEYFAVQCGLQDRNGNLWFGTGGNGIYYYDGKSFTNFTHLDGLCHDDILCCREDKAGNIWFGTRNGLVLYRPTSGNPGRRDFSNYLILANTINSATHAKVPYHFMPAQNFVWCIYEDRAGKMWFGTNYGIYNHVRADTENFTPLFTHFLINDPAVNKDSLHQKIISGIIQDKDGTMWFTSNYINGSGLYRYDGKSVTNFKPEGVSSFRAIIEGKDRKLYFLSPFYGTYCYDGKRFVNFSKQIGLKNDSAAAILQDSKGDFWFGLNSDDLLNGGKGGAMHYDGRSLKLFTTKDGLSHNCIFFMLEDKNKNIWFGTRNTGLCRYDGQSFTDFTGK